MTAHVIRYGAPRSFGDRAWAMLSSVLMTLAAADQRTKAVEPFGL